MHYKRTFAKAEMAIPICTIPYTKRLIFYISFNNIVNLIVYEIRVNLRVCIKRCAYYVRQLMVQRA